MNISGLVLAPNRTDDGGWNGISRLVMLSAVSTGGTMGGIFVISAVTVMEPLQNRGNIYLVNMAMGHLLVTSLVLPASCVAILASIPHDPGICIFQWHTTVVCLMVSVLSFLFMAVENFLGIGSLVTYELCCTKFRIVTVVLFIWGAAVAFSLAQYILSYGPSFCSVVHQQRYWFSYHVSVGSALIALPVVVTVFYLTRSVFKLKTFKDQVESLEDPTAYVLTDEVLLKTNIIIYALFLLMWMPSTIVAAISLVQPVTRDSMDTSWWAALSNSCIYSYVYAAANRDFREAFNKFFYYCCCKSHVNFSRRQRESRRAAPDGIGLRVHIIPGLNIYAQRKDLAATATRVSATTFKSGKGISDL